MRFSTKINLVESINISRDARDNPVLVCASQANADYIITRDEDLLVLKHYKGVKIIKPEEFLAKIGWC